MSNDARTVPQILAGLEDRGIATEGLSPVGVRPTLGRYIGQLWERRHFIWADSRHRVATQNSRNLLGNLWLVLRPMCDAAIYFVVFGLILQADRGVGNFAAYVVIGVLMFRSTMRSISQGPTTLRSGRSMIRAFSFPRAALPISSEIRDGLQMFWTIAVMLVMVMVLPPHEMPQTAWLWVAPIFALQCVLNLGISFVMARIGFLLPDVTQLMTMLGRVLMYGSGVIFPIDNYLTHPTAAAIIQANPIYQMLSMYRGVLMDGTAPAAQSWIILGAWAVGLFVAGFLFFWRGEATYGGER